LGTRDLRPLESMSFAAGDRWLYKAVGNRIGPKTSSKTASKTASKKPSKNPIQTALLEAAWATEATYRQHTSPTPTLRNPDPKNQSYRSIYGSKPLSDCWPLPEESESQNLIFRFYTGAASPTILTSSFAVIADSEGVPTSQVNKEDPITHHPSIASTSGGNTTGTQAPAITVTGDED